jgi:hypothetical protein
LTPITRSRARRLGPGECQRQENGVARRNVGDGNARRDAALGHRDVVGQCRTAERGQVERQHDMALGPQSAGDTARGGEFDAVALVIVERQREQARAGFARQGAGDEGVEPARDERDRDGGGHARALRARITGPQRKKGRSDAARG